jgi:hypothetical protein
MCNSLVHGTELKIHTINTGMYGSVQLKVFCGFAETKICGRHVGGTAV